MNFKHLRYFWTAAKAGGVMRAGEQLHTTPQTLSGQIKQLEERKDNEEARHHPLRHMVTRAVSGEAGIFVDTWEIKVEPGDRVLLCSDGIHSLLPDAELSDLASAQEPLEEICRRIVDAAKREGGTDNSTVILVAVS